MIFHFAVVCFTIWLSRLKSAAGSPIFAYGRHAVEILKV